MKPVCQNFLQNSSGAIENKQLQGSLANLQGGFQAKRTEAVANLPEFEQLRSDGRRIRRQVMAELDAYLTIFENNVLERGGRVHWASTAEDARQAVLEICQNADVKTVTKGKSMVTEEIALNDYLVENAI